MVNPIPSAYRVGGERSIRAREAASAYAPARKDRTMVHLIPRDPEAFSAFVAALVKASKKRRRGKRR